MTHERFRTALVVEPSPIGQRRLRQMMVNSGFERVLLAEGGGQAITAMAADLVDLVLAPWDGPGVSGAELLRGLRARGRNRNVPVVILDHGLSQHAVVASVKAGAAGRLRAPGDVSQFREILATIAGAPGRMKPRGRRRQPLHRRPPEVRALG